jgi:hypothetical protein
MAVSQCPAKQISSRGRIWNRQYYEYNGLAIHRQSNLRYSSDYRIDHETHFKRCWPDSEKSPTYVIEKPFQKGNEACILYDCKTRNGGSSRNTEFFAIEGSKIFKEVVVYFLPQRNQRKQRDYRAAGDFWFS